MATPPGPTYEDYVACVPPANRHKLQQELDCESGDGVDLHLGELAHLLVDWELLAPKLDLSDVDVSDVHSDNKSAELERIDALKRSKSALGFNATYGAYLNIFVENHKAKGALKCAEKIVMQLGATGGPSQSRSHAAQSTPSPLTQAQPSPPHSSPLSPPPSLQYTPHPSLQYTPHPSLQYTPHPSLQYTPPPSLQYSPPLSLPYTHNGDPQPSPYSSLPTSPPYNGHTSSGYSSNGSAVAPMAGTGANVGWATGHAQSHGMPPAPGQAQLPAHSAVSNSPQVSQHTVQVAGRNTEPTKTVLSPPSLTSTHTNGGTPEQHPNHPHPLSNGHSPIPQATHVVSNGDTPHIASGDATQRASGDATQRASGDATQRASGDTPHIASGDATQRASGGDATQRAKMTAEEVAEWLMREGIEKEDVEIFKSHKVNERLFLKLNQCSPKLEHVSQTTKDLLEDLQKDMKNI